jgi:hypothetical protein
MEVCNGQGRKVEDNFVVEGFFFDKEKATVTADQTRFA